MKSETLFHAAMKYTSAIDWPKKERQLKFSGTNPITGEGYNIVLTHAHKEFEPGYEVDVVIEKIAEDAPAAA